MVKPSVMQYNDPEDQNPQHHQWENLKPRKQKNGYSNHKCTRASCLLTSLRIKNCNLFYEMFIPVPRVSELQHFKSFDSGQVGGWTTDDRVPRNDKWRSGYIRAWRRGVEDLPQVMWFPAKTKWRHAELNPFSALCSSDDLRTILRHMGMYDMGTTRGITGADSGQG